MLNATTAKKATKTVLECELRAAWAEVECALRHGQEPSKRVSDYVALITREIATRTAA